MIFCWNRVTPLLPTNVDSQIRLKVEGLRISASDIAYYINSKEGWGWQDAGLLSFELAEQGSVL